MTERDSSIGGERIIIGAFLAIAFVCIVLYLAL